MTKVRNLIIVLGIAILTVTIARASSTSTTSRKNKCDVNWDSKVDISDITRYNGSCKAHDSNTPEWCDLNGDWNSDVSDDVVFQDKCMQIIAWFSVDDEEEEKEYDKCDLNKDSKIDNSDNVRFSNKCSSYSANGPKECDVNGDWKYDISDRVKLTNCLAWTTNWSSSNNEEIEEEEKEYNKCDFNKDSEVDISDIVRYNNKCRAHETNSPKACDLNGDWKFDVSDDITFNDKCLNWEIAGYNEEETECKWMDEANVSHIVNGDTITLKWNVVAGDNVTVEIYDPYSKSYKNLWKFKMSEKKATYKLQWDWEQKFRFDNWCNSTVYKVDTKMTNLNKCDLNKDNTVDISDMVRYNNKCRAHESNSPTSCDLNGDRKFDVSDDITFNDKCLNWEIAWYNNEKENTNTSTWTNKCDLNKDSEVDISDIVRYNNKCRAHESNSPKACDLNGDWKFDISDDIVMENKCVGWEMAWNNKQETTETVETNKRFPDLWTLVYIKKQINLWSTTQYTIWIEKDDENIPVYNVSLFSSSDCAGTSLNTESQKSIWEWWREYSNWEVIEAINSEYAQDINSISYTYNEWKYVCISKKDYPDYFKLNGDSRKVYKYSTQNKVNNQNNKYSEEMNNAYEFAYDNWITTINTIDRARMNGTLTRIEMAKMLSNYAINVLWKTPDTSKQCNFLDVSNSLDAKYDYWITKACQLGIMWQNVKSNKFRPYDTVTRAQFVSALSRMMYWINDGAWNVKYYEPHMSKLYNEWIISKKDPKMEEKRWNVMLMVYRASE